MVMDASISIACPVFGLRPTRAERSLAINVPNPDSWTASRLESCCSMIANKANKTSSPLAGDISAASLR